MTEKKFSGDRPLFGDPWPTTGPQNGGAKTATGRTGSQATVLYCCVPISTWRCTVITRHHVTDRQTDRRHAGSICGCSIIMGASITSYTTGVAQGGNANSNSRTVCI